MKPFKLLIVDDDATIRSLLSSRFGRRAYEVKEAENGESAINLSKSFFPDVVITDIRMPHKDGFDVIKGIKTPTIIITGHGDKESAIKAVEAGAFAFFEKPFDMDQLEIAVKRAAERYHLEQEKELLLKKLDHLCRLQDRELESFDKKVFSSFIGESAGILQIKEMISRLAKKPTATLLVLGESGTGKEVVARELHRSTHAEAQRIPFLALNCAAIPTELLESELYGHEKGSFSGAQSQRIGLAEAARTGTLFLDEIGDMDPKHQAKLLRLLQEKKFRRVGSNLEHDFTGRIVAATHRNLQKFSEEERFREDLYYRLSVVSLTLPPLRERGQDLLLLAESLCRKYGLAGLSPERIAELQSYNWPGNIRELNNWIERASILGEHDEEGFVIAPVPNTRRRTDDTVIVEAAVAAGFEGSNKNIKDLRQKVLDDFDRKIIQDALMRFGGNITAASKHLGIDRKNLSKRMRDLGIEAAREAA